MTRLDFMIIFATIILANTTVIEQMPPFLSEPIVHYGMSFAGNQK